MTYDPNDGTFNDDLTDSDDPNVIAQELYRLSQELEAIEAEQKAEREAQAEIERQIKAEREAFEARIATLKEEKYKLEVANWDKTRVLREAKRKKESAERKLQLAQAHIEKAAEWATLEKRWDLLTMGAPWREWAKDHQLDGAKKMTYEGKMILGDTMGLGKTLTSLIAIDMIEAATKDASPSNPVEFGGMK